MKIAFFLIFSAIVNEGSAFSESLTQMDVLDFQPLPNICVGCRIGGRR
jgi:hypothetical protein